MPIAFKIYEALYEELEPKKAIYDLMTRDLKSEFSIKVNSVLFVAYI